MCERRGVSAGDGGANGRTRFADNRAQPSARTDRTMSETINVTNPNSTVPVARGIDRAGALRMAIGRVRVGW